MTPSHNSSDTGRSAQTARWLRWRPAAWSLGMGLAGLIHLIGPAAVAADQARLKLSAQLLKLATVVHQQSPG